MSKCFIIAEAGVNHNGSLEVARKMIEVAASAGADAVKFQTFRTEALVSASAPRAEYQIRAMKGDESQAEMLKKLELDESAHSDLIAHAKQVGIEFLSTPFDSLSLRLLTERFGIRTIKIPSGEITNGPFLLQIARSAEKIILSTGMSDLSEVEAALAIIAFGFLNPTGNPDRSSLVEIGDSQKAWDELRNRVILLHATTEYPAPMSEVNLRAMDTLASSFGLKTGYSDHTRGIHVAVAAVARGACVIEKHFTMDRGMEGPDHKASLEPPELKEMIVSIRDVEQALGDGRKRPTISERKNMSVARKSLVALREIQSGQDFTEENLGIKRPGNGISPMAYWNWIGKKATRTYSAEELLNE